MSKLKFNSPKVCSKSTTLLQCLCKHLIFTNVIITNGATGEFHCFFKVTTSDFRYWVLVGLKVYIKKLVFYGFFLMEYGLTSIAVAGLSARSRSRRISVSMACRMANLHARWQISVKSAPEKPCVTFAK